MLEDNSVVKKCYGTCGANLGYNWGWLASLILWLIVVIVLWWLILFSLKPPLVLYTDSNQVNPSKVLFWAIIFAIITIIVVVLIKWAIHKL